jgi:hypothetical protein
MESRMRQLVRALLVDVQVRANGSIALAGQPSSLAALGEFLCQEFPKEVGRSNADAYVWLLMLRASGQMLPSDSAEAPISSILTPEQIEEMVSGFVAWWAAVPRDYEFLFPLPQVKGLRLPLQFGPDVELRMEQWRRDDMIGQVREKSPRSSRAAVSEDVATLSVRARGIAMLGSADESACAHALQLAKVFLELCCATRLLERQEAADPSKCRTARVVEAGERARKDELALPAAFSDAFRCCVAGNPVASGDPLDGLAAVAKGMRQQEQARAEVARVLSRIQWGMAHDDSGNELAVQKQANRLATAAAWLFDARADDYTANRVVRAAIALEALVGGETREGVESTLSNRLQYSIGDSVEDRSEIARRFPEFYALRSRVVHGGQIRLGENAHDLLDWGEKIVTRALRAELGMLPDA